MRLETERLELIPLTLEQLKLWVSDIAALEEELNCVYKAEAMEGFFLGIVKGQIKILERDPDNFVWHSFWFLIRKSDRVVVGSADFKAAPNQRGEVEIGYGLGEAFEHHGYMTEAVKAICSWGLDQKGVKSIIAETELNGFASQHILKRCGFIEEKRGETLWFRLKGDDYEGR